MKFPAGVSPAGRAPDAQPTSPADRIMGQMITNWPYRLRSANSCALLFPDERAIWRLGVVGEDDGNLA